MYHTVTPPYSVIQGGTDKPAENPNCSWGYDTRDPKYRKFIDIMGADVTVANPGKAGQMKRLPISNWNAGNLIKKMPNLRGTTDLAVLHRAIICGKLQWLGIEQQQFSHVRF